MSCPNLKKEEKVKRKMKSAFYLYSTIRRGKVKVRSVKQHRLLHVRGLPHTHVYRKKGKIVKKRWKP